MYFKKYLPILIAIGLIIPIITIAQFWNFWRDNGSGGINPAWDSGLGTSTDEISAGWFGELYADTVSSTDIISSGLATFSGGLISTASSTFTDDVDLGDGTLFIEQSAGRVGIGTTTPNNTLQVQDYLTFDGNSTYFGYTAGAYSTGNHNTAIGYQSMAVNTTGYQNAALGYQSLYLNETGYRNNAFGVSSLRSNTSGLFNSAFAHSSLYSNTTGSYNQGMGYSALYYNQTGSRNTALGYNAGWGTLNNSYSNNIFIGYQAGDNVTIGSHNIVIGHDIDLPVASGDNQMSIGNLIFATGLDASSTAISSGNVGIATTTPEEQFVVNLACSNAFVVDSTGNVAIGHCEPSYDLDIRDTRAQISVESLTGTNTVWQRFRNTGSDVIVGQESSTGGAIFAGSLPYAAIFGHGGAYPLQLVTSGTDRLTINSTGNVGIGTTGPGAKLEVMNSSALQLRLRTTATAANHWALGRSPTDGTFQIVDGGGTERLVINPTTGNVGIGTTGPNSKLDVQSAASENIIVATDSGSKAGIFLGDDGTSSFIKASYWSDGSFHPLRLQVGGNDAVYVKTDGNVGIGTTSPGAKLEVAGGDVWIATTTGSTHHDLSVGGRILADGYDEYSPMFMGEAMKKIKAIKPEANSQQGDWAEVDHSTLPAEIQSPIRLEWQEQVGTTTKEQIVPAVYDEEGNLAQSTTTELVDVPLMEDRVAEYQGRDLGKMVQLLQKGLIEQSERIDYLESRLAELEKQLGIKPPPMGGEAGFVDIKVLAGGFGALIVAVLGIIFGRKYASFNRKTTP